MKNFISPSATIRGWKFIVAGSVVVILGNAYQLYLGEGLALIAWGSIIAHIGLVLTGIYTIKNT